MVQNSRYGHREMEGVTCLGRGSICSVRVPASQTWKGEEKSLLSRWVVNAMSFAHVGMLVDSRHISVQGKGEASSW